MLEIKSGERFHPGAVLGTESLLDRPDIDGRPDSAAFEPPHATNVLNDRLPTGLKIALPADQGTIDAFQQIINGLPEQIALLDADWNILVVNDAWIKTASMYRYDELLPGTNYHEFCRTKAAQGHAPAALVAAGIEEMDAGTKGSFHFIYHGKDRWQGHAFQLSVTRLRIGGRAFSTVTRYDVTEVVNLRALRQDFSHSMIEGQSEERRRIAREIHDSTMQSLVALGLSLGQIKRAGAHEGTVEIVAEMENILSDAQRELRAISYLSHPPLLAEMGLGEALRGLVTGFQKRTGLAVTLNLEGDTTFGWRAAEVAIYRLVQEALSNVHRHARATSAAVGLICRRGMIHIAVLDNGIGIPAEPAFGVGLTGMRERFSELGGRLKVKSAVPGTMVLASLAAPSHIRAVGDLALRP